MRTEWKVAALSLALLLGACGKRQEPTVSLSDDLKRDLAAASPAGGDLTTAPQSYRRMRFVSDIEQSKAAVPAKRPTLSHHHVKPTIRRQPVSEESTTDVALDPVVRMASESPAPASTPEAPAPEPSIVIAHQPSPEPTSAPSGSTSGGRVGDGDYGGVGDGGHGGVGGGDHGGGLGGLIGGIIGGVVIRGGHGGVDKCDPRTDGRARPTIDVPIFIQPTFPGRPFPGSRRR